MSWWYNLYDLVAEVFGYPLSWFEQVGQAVANAFGGFFHNIIDFFLSFVYFGLFVYEIFKSLFLPVEYVFKFLKTAISSFAGDVSYQASLAFDENALALFNSIPMFETLMIILGAILCLFVVFATIKILSN